MADTLPKQKTLIVIAIVAILLLFFFIPLWNGYRFSRTIKEAGVDSADVVALQEAKESAEASSVEAEEALARAQESVHEAALGVSSAEEALAACQAQAVADKKLWNDLADSLAQEKADVQDDFDEVEATLEGAANQLCCVQQIFDSAIVGYDIDDDKVECVTSEGTALSC